MPIFDPNAQHGDGRQSGTVPAGEYLIAPVYIDHRTSKTGNPYVRVRWEVIAGDRAGETFFANVMLFGGRLAIWCKAIGHLKPFDTSDKRAVGAIFAFKPIKARVRVVENNGYTNNEIERIELDVSDRERRAMEGWVLDLEERRAMTSSRGGGSGSGSVDPGFDDAPPPGDDDIPF